MDQRIYSAHSSFNKCQESIPDEDRVSTRLDVICATQRRQNDDLNDIRYKLSSLLIKLRGDIPVAGGIGKEEPPPCGIISVIEKNTQDTDAIINDLSGIERELSGLL